MRYINPDRRTILKTMTSLAAASSMAKFTVGPASAAAASDPALSPALGEVDQALRQAVNAQAVPGLVAIAANDKGIVYEGAFGPSISADSVFWIASMTKAVTGVACMQLVEQGKLQLDQPMGKLLPQLEQPKVLEGFDASGAPKLRPAKRAITLRHLLTHTAGFTYSIWSEPMAKFEKVTGTPSIGECRNASFNAPLMFDPGDRWEYGINMDWVGKAVEAASDQSLEVYFKEKIFAPLGMTDTGFLDQFLAKGPCCADVQPASRRLAEADGFRNAAKAGILHGRRCAVQHAAKLHCVSADVAARRHVQRRASAEARDRGVNATEPHRRYQRGHFEDSSPGAFERRKPVPRHDPEMGTVVRHQHPTRPGRPQRGQPRLGRIVQHLLLA
jgi:CubicO group peptidase (beta-lactamase class C family)